MSSRSVILLSGGLDSTANLAFCRESDDPVLAITVDYGQRAAAREIEAARAFCSYYQVEQVVLELKWLGDLGGNSLTDTSQALPEFERSQLEDVSKTMKSARSVWVPNRNGVLINVAAAYAERRDCSQVVVGFNREEAATFPDNGLDFLNCATQALEYSTRNRVRAHSYTSVWDKKEIVRRLRALSNPFPFDLVWSCYDGGPARCGVCESCQRFQRAVETE